MMIDKMITILDQKNNQKNVKLLCTVCIKNTMEIIFEK